MYPVAPAVQRSVFPVSRTTGASIACRVEANGTAAPVIREYPVDPFTASRVAVVLFIPFTLLSITPFTIVVVDAGVVYMVVAAVVPRIVPKLLYVSGMGSPYASLYIGYDGGGISGKYCFCASYSSTVVRRLVCHRGSFTN